MAASVTKMLEIKLTALFRYLYFIVSGVVLDLDRRVMYPTRDSMMQWLGVQAPCSVAWVYIPALLLTKGENCGLDFMTCKVGTMTIPTS